ncbi:MAG: RHS repeat domain-containing protein [bacterium]
MRDQLTGVTGPVNASFAYDGLARRRSKTVSGSTTQFLYDLLNPVQELAGGSPTANLLTGLGIDEFFTRTDSVGARHYLADALGSTVALSDGAGAVVTEYTYEPFGAFVASGGTTNNTFTYTGREADGTGLFSYRARYYQPGSGRFVSEDPLGLWSDFNLYGYVRNSPLNAVDPLGLIELPPNPGGLGPEWKLDPTHKDPNGVRYRDPSGRPLDWHPRQPGKPGWRGRDHWHDPTNFGRKHLPPGTKIPDPVRLPKPPRRWWPRWLPLPFPLPLLIELPIPIVSPCLLEPSLCMPRPGRPCGPA